MAFWFILPWELFTNLFSDFFGLRDVGDIAAGKKYPNQVFFDIAAGDFFLWLSISARRAHQPPKTSENIFLKLTLPGSIFLSFVFLFFFK